MLNSPLGGISLFTSMIIIAVGSLLSRTRRSKKRVIISQADILKAQESKLGSFLILSFAYLVPLLIFTSLTGISAIMLYDLYKDKERVTILSLVEKSFLITKKGFVTPGKEFTRENITLALAVPELEISNEKDSFFLKATNAPAAVQLYEGNLAFAHMLKVSNELGITADDPKILFPKKRTDKKLLPFLRANNINTSFENRKEYADFFGIEKYTGTEHQNNLLRRKIGEVTSQDIKKVILSDMPH